MKILNMWLPAVVAFSLIISGCSSPVYVQKDESVNFSNYKTYMWVDTRKNENDNSPRPTAYVDISMRNNANRELQRLGWREVTDNPDVLVSYDVLVERSTEQQREPVYTQPFTRSYYNPYTRRWSTLYYPSEFIGYDVYETPVKEGTITVTLIDARTDKNIWQGWTTERLDNTRITDDEIARSVKHIFGKFDVAMR
jgi:hypothetical protein